MRWMSNRLVKRRVVVALLSGAICSILAVGILWLLWPLHLAPISPVAVALTGVLGAAGGAFGALILLDQTKQGQDTEA